MIHSALHLETPLLKRCLLGCPILSWFLFLSLLLQLAMMIEDGHIYIYICTANTLIYTYNTVYCSNRLVDPVYSSM